jgi:phosphatidyl-myo-inositol dimannoside synthase
VRALVVTNDFPPRQGGIESFVLALARRLPPEAVVVYTAAMPGDRDVDRTLPFPVYRDSSATLLPTPGVSRRARRLLRAEGCTSVLFGAAAPLGLLAPALREAGARRIVGLTHGHETWWARVPGARAALRRIGDATDVLTYLGDYTRRIIAGALSDAAAARMVRLPPGVDPDRFRPGAGGARVRRRLGIDPDRPVVACVARLKPRKGQDMLVRSLPWLLRRVPDALVLLVGGGPDRPRLERLVDSVGVRRHVLFTGPVPWAELPPYFDAADVFAMPCRTRRLGLEPEALGIVFLEASATGLPVVVGDSGGAPDACLPGQTGFVVDGTRPARIAARVGDLLLDRDLAARMGRRGRAWMREAWHWDDLAARLAALLDG